MKKRCFIFCHGFGFNANFWQHLRPFFTHEHCIYLDLGYGGKTYLPHLKKDICYIGVGHSLGLIKLYHLFPWFDYYVGLNSFTNFLGNSAALQTVRQPQLQTLIDHFTQSPQLTLKNFYRRCGVNGMNVVLHPLNKDLLHQDLQFLAKNMLMTFKVPVSILASNDDTIVPPPLIEDNFSGAANVQVHFFSQGKHALGWSCPKQVYEKIRDFLDAYQ